MAEYIIDTTRAEQQYPKPSAYHEMFTHVLGSPIEEELIRCKDCKFSHILSADQWPANRCPELAGKMYCTQWSEDFYGVWTEPNGYCHKGTKR